MQRKITLLIITIIMVLTCEAQKKESADTLMTCECHVVSAENNAPLAFVSVYVKQGIGTITNEDGDFKINISPDETLQISYMGYEKMRIKASELPKKIKLKPLEHTLDEVTVMPVNGILKKALKELYVNYKKNKKSQSKYFLRQITYANSKELVEAFIQAKSAVNLRDLAFICGRHGTQNGQELGNSHISSMNFHHELELGPKIYDNSFWKMTSTPFGMIEGQGSVEKVYNDSIDVIKDEDGNKIYCITLTPKPNVPKKYTSLYGTLYIDATTFHLLHFKGKIEGMALDYRKDFVHQMAPTNADIEVNYRYVKGFNEVESIFTSFTSGNLGNKSLIFNIDALAQQEGEITEADVKNAKKEKYAKLRKVGENMLASINDENFEAVMAENANFVKRTTEETELAEGKIAPTENILLTHYEIQQGSEKKTWNVEPLNTQLGNTINRLAKVGQRLPQEKVYIHMDNNCYFLGDTIWFSAYLRQMNDNKPSEISGILYVELLNQDGYLMQRKVINMRNGRGHGNFSLNRDWYGGYYELRAYTRWQLNWGITERPHSEMSKNWFINDEMEHRYFRDYEKLYSRVFPVYDAPKKAGKYSKEMTTRELQRKFKNDPDGRELQLSLYPEGGQAIVNAPCRVAFEARYSNGEYANGKLVLKGDSSQHAITLNRGRGIYTVTPKSTDKLNFVFTTIDGKETATATLNNISDKGVVLRVEQHNSSWSIDAFNFGIKDSLALSVMHEGRVKVFCELPEAGASYSLVNKDLEPGVNQATIFDGQGRIYAERLFFVTDTCLVGANLHISGVKDTYLPYEKVDLSIKADSTLTTNGGNILSVSIHDKANTDILFDNASMMTEMLLASEVKGFIPNPESFFAKDDSQHRKALDLLMMTQGWRRFDWRQMAVSDEWSITQPDEPTPIITGEIYDYPSRNFYNTELWDVNVEPTEKSHIQEKGGVTEIDDPMEIINQTIQENKKKANNTVIPKDVVVLSMLSNKKRTYQQILQANVVDGHFSITLPKFKDRLILYLSANDTSKTVNNFFQPMPARNNEVTPAKYSIRVDDFHPRFVKPYSYYQQMTQIGFASTVTNSIPATSKNKSSLRAHMNDSQPALIVDGYEALNYAIDAGMPYSDPYYIMRAYVGDYGSDRPYITSFDSITQKKANKEERIEYIGGKSLLENTTTNRDSLYMRKYLSTKGIKHYDTEWRRLENIDKFVFYTDYQPRFYGSKRYQGNNLPYSYNVIYNYPEVTERKMYRDRRIVLEGITKPAEFYSPQYDQMKLPEQHSDYRRTLYWNPELKLDKEGKADITFYNNSQETQIVVDAQGLSNDGVILHGNE